MTVVLHLFFVDGALEDEVGILNMLQGDEEEQLLVLVPTSYESISRAQKFRRNRAFLNIVLQKLILVVVRSSGLACPFLEVQEASFQVGD